MFYYQDERSRPSGLVVLSAAVPVGTSVGAGARDGRLDALRLRQGAVQRLAWSSVGPLPGPWVPLYLVPPPARQGQAELKSRSM